MRPGAGCPSCPGRGPDAGAALVVPIDLAVAFRCQVVPSPSTSWRWNSIVALVLSVWSSLGLVIQYGQSARPKVHRQYALVTGCDQLLITLGPLALLQSGWHATTQCASNQSRLVDGLSVPVAGRGAFGMETGLATSRVELMVWADRSVRTSMPSGSCRHRGAGVVNCTLVPICSGCGAPIRSSSWTAVCGPPFGRANGRRASTPSRWQRRYAEVQRSGCRLKACSTVMVAVENMFLQADRFSGPASPGTDA